jgi:hypothetical protein
MVSVTRESQSGGIKVTMVRPSLKLAAVVIAILALILLGAVVAVQQEQIGSLSRQASQVAQGTVLINGTRYAYVDVPLASLTYPAVFKFDGVTFNATANTTGPFEVTFVSPSPSPPAGFNGTVITVTETSGTLFENATQIANGTPITFHLTPWPSIKVTFSDGVSEYYQGGTVALSSQSSVSPWFSQHSNPRAGIMWDSASNSYYLYVSLESSS